MELQDGDAVIVVELSRLGRNILEYMDILALAFDRIKFYGTLVSFVGVWGSTEQGTHLRQFSLSLGSKYSDSEPIKIQNRVY